jgi:hypothetical protein
MTISSDGKVGICTTSPSEVLDVVGTIECVHVTETSDERLKENIADIEELSICKIMAIKARSWDWKNPELGKTIGFVAQELEQIIPESVVTRPAIEAKYTVNEEGEEVLQQEAKEESKAIVPTVILTHLVKAVQEQQTVIEQLQARIDKLEKE